MDYLVCSRCGKKYSVDEPIWRCECGGYLDLEFEAVIDTTVLKDRKFSIWRYREALPIKNDRNIVSLGEGFTPIIKENIFSKDIFLKLDYLFPTGSFKDRGASVLVSKINELGVQDILEDSSGNAACSIASYSAKAGIKCSIYVPANVSSDKLTQILAYGAEVKRVEGDREDVSRVALRDAENRYYASHVWNPFFFQGTKTFSYEVWEQFGHDVPDFLILPMGNGTLLIGAYLGFLDLKRNGLIKEIPTFIGVQTECCAPVFELWRGGDGSFSYDCSTIAEGIAIRDPLRLEQMINVINCTSGDIVTVPDNEIKLSLVELFKRGIYVEPTSAAVIAALKKINISGNVLLPLTGIGMKDSEIIEKILEGKR